MDGGAGDDGLFGGNGYDALYGGDGNDNLYGEADADQLWGGAGDDFLNGGLGDDNLHGGVGNDQLYGDAGNDRLYGDDGGDLLTGGDGNDLLDGGAGDDGLFGGNGYDALYGGDGNDNLYGEGDADQLWGGAGDDFLSGGFGDDNLNGGVGNDQLYGDAGNDQLHGEDGGDLLTGGDGNDLLDGGAGDDGLFGGNGYDALYGGDGNDNLYGEGNDDRLSGGAGDDLLNGGQGDDTLHGDAGNDTLVGEDGNDQLFGDDGNDQLSGNAGNDVLLGGNDADYLVGGDGSDVLIGGAGKDSLAGGDGDDILIGGSTDYDADLTKLQAISADWSNGTSYATRVQTITDALFTSSLTSADDPGELSAVAGGHIIDDQVSDSLSGGDGQDWFFETGTMPMYLPSDVQASLQTELANGVNLLQCGDQVMNLTSQVPTLEGFNLFDSLDTPSDRLTSETLTSLVPKADSTSLEQEHLALMQLVRYDQVTNYAIRSGTWSDPTIWHGGVVPATGAHVLIPIGVTVEVDGQIPARLSTVRVDGSLSFDPTHNTQLQVDTMVVSDCGEFSMGTAAAPIARGITARLLITDNGAIDRTWDPYGISRGLITQGSVSIYGSEVTSYAALAAPLYAGAKTLNVKTVPVGWNVGDELVIAATTEGTTQNEVRHIKAIVGNSVVLDQALTYNHVAAESDLDVNVANVTRNAVIQSEATTIDRYGHVMFMHNNDVHLAYAGFYHLGRTDKSTPINDPVVLSDWTLKPGTGTNPRARYAVHFHRTGTVNDGNPATVLGCAVVDSPGWGYDNHSSYVVMTDNVAFDVNGAGFVTEVGDEIGGFYNNLAIGTTGTGESVDVDSRTNVQDFGFQGDGFWFQGTGVSVVGNISAGNQDSAFTIYSRGLTFNGVQAHFSAANLVDPSLAQGASSIPVDLVPIREFKNNVGYSSNFGLRVEYHLEHTTLDESSVIQDSVFWNNETGVSLPYTENTTLLNLKVIHDDSSHPRTGIASNTVTRNDNYENLTVEGYFIGIDAPRQGTSIISGGVYNNTHDVQLSSAMRQDRNILITNMSPQFKVTTLAYTLGGVDEPVDIFFVKDTVILDYGPYINQQLYSLGQVASFIPFPEPRLDAPAAYIGLTNQQLWNEFGVTLGGAIAPPSAVTEPYIVGLVAPPSR